MTSDVYQRQAVGHNLEAVAEDRFFVAPDRRRMTAEQVVDSLFVTSGQSMDVEEITFDIDNRHSADVMISLGKPNRAWQFGALSNERDRPSLSLPRAQMVTDVLEAFGWNGSRQNAITMRDQQPNVIQPGILAGGVLTTWITRASNASSLANLACETTGVEQLVDSLFLRFLARYPNSIERQKTLELLSVGFQQRLIPKDQVVAPKQLPQLSYVSWTNHLKGEANEIMLEHDRRVRSGPAVDPRLETQWREVLEDVVWSLVNSPEFVWIP